MTVKEQYKREYQNYLRRVNRAVKQGYVVNVVRRVKKPTRASINRLKQQTGEKIRTKSEIVDVETGVILKPIKNKKKRLAQQRKNVNILKADLQTVANTVENNTAFSPIQGMSNKLLPPSDSYEQLIDNWYQQVRESFYWYIAQFIEWQTNKLIYGKSEETRKRFAYVFSQHPDLFPEPPYETRDVILKSFDEIARMMELAPDSEAYQDFLSMYDGVEIED
ncbi:MAG: hypothetical protein [Bacteriophage sp.]|nr:MAG: hypothetical protein [Bacteriophage sp.]